MRFLSRRGALVNLTDDLLANLDKVGGIRLECRLRGSDAGDAITMADAVGRCRTQLDRLLSIAGPGIPLRRVPVLEFNDFVKKELAAAIDSGTFRGMRDAGPDPANEEQVLAFTAKVKQWATLVANLGFYSGHFARLVPQGGSNQAAPLRASDSPGGLAVPVAEEAGEPAQAGDDVEQALSEHEEPAGICAADGGEESDAEDEGDAEEDAPVAGEIASRIAPQEHDLEDGPLTQLEESVKASTAFLKRKRKDGHEAWVFRYAKPFGRGGAQNTSSWFTTRDAAARAIAAWAGADWRRRVQCEPAPQPEAAAVPAARVAPKEVNMHEPLSDLERQILAEIWTGCRRSRAGGEWVVFKYLPHRGPAGRQRFSSWYRSPEHLARAVALWAGADWRQMVEVANRPEQPAEPAALLDLAPADAAEPAELIAVAADALADAAPGEAVAAAGSLLPLELANVSNNLAEAAITADVRKLRLAYASGIQEGCHATSTGASHVLFQHHTPTIPNIVEAILGQAGRGRSSRSDPARSGYT